MKMVAVILSGGIGSRIWPLSRELRPKPFIKLNNEYSLIQLAYSRVEAIQEVNEIVTVTNKELAFYTKEQYEAISKRQIYNTFILEPFGRNSAAAVALSNHYVKKKYGEDCALIIIPADHLIKDQKAFNQSVYEAVKLSSQGQLVTFGIQPTQPKTEYGYILADKNKVLQFTEKPDYETAKSFIEAGNYLWNAGIFVMYVGKLNDEMDQHCSAISVQAEVAINKSERTDTTSYSKILIQEEDFKYIQSTSIDYALFEKSHNVSVVSCNFDWSDVGSFLEISQLFPVDENANNVFGEVILEDVENSFIYTEGRLVSGLGFKNLIIVDTEDALLVVEKSKAQEVRKIVNRLKKNNHDSHHLFPTVHRPWGTYTVLNEGNGFKLKRIEVKPGAALSLQSHQYRSEHWIVVSGIAKVTNGDKVFELTQDQSTYIPACNQHRLENFGDKILILIELQCGSYLCEDDIVRYQDAYGRCGDK